jgi:hypothetical protein
MADYYSLLARAVSNLPKSSPPTVRRAIYDRARAALVNQLRSLKPQLPDSDIAREESALDAAIARLEGEYEPAAGTPEPVAPALRPPPRAEPAKPLPAPPVARAPLAAAPARTEPKLPPAAPIVAAPPRAPTASAPAANRAPLIAAADAPRVLAAPAPITSEAPKISSFVAPRASDVATRNLAAPTPPPVIAAKVDDAARPDDAPRIAAPARTEYASVETNRLDVEPPRPIAPPARELERANPWPWVALAVVVGLVGSVAVAALLLRQKPQDLAVPEPSETTAPAHAASGPKIDQRVAGSPTPEPTAPSTPATTPTPTPTPADAGTPTPSATSTPADSPTPAASPTPAPSPTPEATRPTSIPVAARAAMLVAEGSDTQNPAVNLGSVVWSVVPPTPGQPGSGGFKAEVDIPDLKMHASMVMRKNVDANLPASHTIDFRASFEPGSPIKGIKDIGLPLMRRDDPPGADPLLGVHVKINDGYYLVGLNRADADVTRNIDEIGTRGWFDFPMQLADDRIAKLTFEKSAEGERVVNEAIAAWK